MKFQRTLLFAIILLLIFPNYAVSQKEGKETESPIGESDNGQIDSVGLENLHKNAEQGNVFAQFGLGNMYYYGKEITQDYKKAIRWYRKSAEQGYPPAQFKLGMIYHNGEGVPQDSTEAAKWFRKAAEQNNASAQLQMGLMYVQGNGTPQDFSEAEKWFRKAAEQNIPAAQFNLGLMYLQGNEIPQNYEEAAKWLRMAAELGDSSAQGMLGAVYIEGWGVSQDYIKAYMWLTLCIDGSTNIQSQVLEKAKNWFELVAQKMTAQQIEEARRLAREWNQDQVSKRERVTMPKEVLKPKRVPGNLQKSKLIKHVEPRYPEIARRQKISGVVILVVTIDEEGNVARIEVSKGVHPSLDEAAIEAVKQWKYSPTLLNGKPIPVIATTTVNFMMGK